ncbi:unnamed protein product [Clonostachys rhizophaga]|uniref:Heterokaryon incompatibility domain-containing protein n=1 Tax=Clonostachys rhizophaga TaxID=160324 RepID=A0A9N9UZS8_9HYPO|nr:unnamed protein product [Clonostachys rhizophaga]
MCSTSSPVRVALEETRGRTGSYLCLSHRWCRSETERTRTTLSNYQERQAGSGFENLDPLFLDVFLVAARISVEYVWIDSLCIIQDSPEDSKTESAQMSDYYQNAVLTIMAAIPPEKRALGLFHFPEYHLYKLYRLPYRNTTGTRDGYFYLSRQFDQLAEQGKDVEKNELLSRGWVFQERMFSRRIAWYTEQGIILQCKCQEAERWSASSVDLDPSPGIERLLCCLYQTSFKFKGLPGYGFETLSGPFSWHAIASKYSALKLSKPWKDRLIALKGVAQEYAAQEGKSSLVCGLRPWCLDLDLLWEQKEPGIHSRLDGFPTWSWASIDTSVVWANVHNVIALMELRTITSTAGNHSQDPGTGTGSGTTTDREERNGSFYEGLVTLPRHKSVTTGQVVAASQAPEASLNALHIFGRLLPVIFGPVLNRPSDVQFRLASHYACRKNQWPSREVPRRLVSLTTEQGAIAGWSSLEEPDLQDDQAFVPNPIIFALFVSVSSVYRYGTTRFKALYGKEDIFNVLFIRPSGILTNGFVRLGTGRLFGSKVQDAIRLSRNRDIVLL